MHTGGVTGGKALQRSGSTVRFNFRALGGGRKWERDAARRTTTERARLFAGNTRTQRVGAASRSVVHCDGLRCEARGLRVPFATPVDRYDSA